MNNKTLLTIILMVVVFGAGFLMGRMTASGVTVFTEGDTESANPVGQASDDRDTSAATTDGTTIDSSSMTDDQRILISALGLDPNNVTVTAEMITCAEAELGAARVEEIKNGATPSFTEGASLVACY